MFRWVSKLFGGDSRSSEDRRTARRHSFEEINRSDISYHTRSKCKKRCSPEPKRRRSDEPSPDSLKSLKQNLPQAGSQHVNTEDNTEKMWEKVDIPDHCNPECIVIADPPSPEHPIVVEKLTSSVWQASDTKENMYKDCVVIETSSEYKDRLLKDRLLPDFPADEGVRMSTGSFVNIEGIADALGTIEERKIGDKNENALSTENKNENAPLESGCSNSAGSENMSFSYVQIDLDEKSSEKQKCQEGLKSDKKLAVDSKEMDLAKVDKGEKEIGGNVDPEQSPKYVVPKMPLAKGKGSKKSDKSKNRKTPEKVVKERKTDLSMENDSNSDQKAEHAESSDKTTSGKDLENNSDAKKVEEDITKPETDKPQESEEKSDKVTKKYVIPSRRNKDIAKSAEKTTISPEKAVKTPEKSEVEQKSEPKNFIEFVNRKSSQGSVVDAKKLIFELGFLKDVDQAKIENTVLQQYKIAADKKYYAWVKEVRYNAELIFSQKWIEDNLPPLGKKDRKNDWQKKKRERKQREYSEYENKAKGGMCRDVRLDSDPSLQVVRENVGTKQQSQLSKDDGKSRTSSDDQDKLKSQHQQDDEQSKTSSDDQDKLKSQHQKDDEQSKTSSDYQDKLKSQHQKDDGKSKTSSDVQEKLKAENPNMEVSDQISPTKVTTEPNNKSLETAGENLKMTESRKDIEKSRSKNTDARSSRLKYTDVRLDANPHFDIVRENVGERSKQKSPPKHASSRLKYTDVRLETNPQFDIVRENAGERIKEKSPPKHASSRLKYTDVRLETNPQFDIVRENAGERSKEKSQPKHASSRLKYTDVRLETNPNLQVVRENAGGKFKNSLQKSSSGPKSDVGLKIEQDSNFDDENVQDKHKKSHDKDRKKNDEKPTSSKLKYTDVRLEINPDLPVVKENAADKAKLAQGEATDTALNRNQNNREFAENSSDVNISKSNVCKLEEPVTEREIEDLQELAQGNSLTNEKTATTVMELDCKNTEENLNIKGEKSFNTDVVSESTVLAKSTEKMELEKDRELGSDKDQIKKQQIENESNLSESVKDSNKEASSYVCSVSAKESSETGTYKKYSEAVKASVESNDAGTKQSTIRKEVSSSLNSLLAIVETEISKTFDSNGNPISSIDSNQCDKKLEFSEKSQDSAESGTIELDKDTTVIKENVDEKKQECGRKEIKKTEACIISEVNVRETGEGLIVNTKLEEESVSSNTQFIEALDLVPSDKEGNNDECISTHKGDKPSEDIVKDPSILSENVDQVEIPLVGKLVAEVGTVSKIVKEVNVPCSSVVDTMPLLTQSVQAIVEDVAVLNVQKELEQVAKNADFEKPAESGKLLLENVDVAAKEGQTSKEPLPIPDQSVESVQGDISHQHFEKVTEDSVKKESVENETQNDRSNLNTKESLLLTQGCQLDIENLEMMSVPSMEMPSHMVSELTGGTENVLISSEPEDAVPKKLNNKISLTDSIYSIVKDVNASNTQNVLETMVSDIGNVVEMENLLVENANEKHASIRLDNGNEGDDLKGGEDIGGKILVDLSKNVKIDEKDENLLVAEITNKQEDLQLANKSKATSKANVHIGDETKDVLQADDKKSSTNNVTLPDRKKSREDVAQADGKKYGTDDMAHLKESKSEVENLPLGVDKKSKSDEGDVQDKIQETPSTDIKSIEKGLKDLITEMAAKENKSTEDLQNSACAPNTDSSQTNIFSPLALMSDRNPTLVRSCENLQTSDSDSIENLSVKSESGDHSYSKSFKRGNNRSRIQQPKSSYSYSRSYESLNTTSAKDRSWHYPSTPGGSGSSRHDGCKQSTPGRYDRPFNNSPRFQRHHGSYTSRGNTYNSGKYDSGNYGRGASGSTPRGMYKKQNYKTPTGESSNRYSQNGKAWEKKSSMTSDKSYTEEKQKKHYHSEKYNESKSSKVTSKDTELSCDVKPKKGPHDQSHDKVKLADERSKQSTEKKSENVQSKSVQKESKNVPVEQGLISKCDNKQDKRQNRKASESGKSFDKAGHSQKDDTKSDDRTECSQNSAAIKECSIKSAEKLEGSQKSVEVKECSQKGAKTEYSENNSKKTDSSENGAKSSECSQGAKSKSSEYSQNGARSSECSQNGAKSSECLQTETTKKSSNASKQKRKKRKSNAKHQW